MILQADVAFDGRVFEVFHVFEFALGHPLVPIRAAQFVLQKFDAVEPVLQVPPIRHHPHRVPFPAGIASILDWSIEIVTGSGQLAHTGGRSRITAC